MIEISAANGKAVRAFVARMQSGSGVAGAKAPRISSGLRDGRCCRPVAWISLGVIRETDSPDYAGANPGYETGSCSPDAIRERCSRRQSSPEFIRATGSRPWSRGSPLDIKHTLGQQHDAEHLRQHGPMQLAVERRGHAPGAQQHGDQTEAEKHADRQHYLQTQ